MKYRHPLHPSIADTISSLGLSPERGAGDSFQVRVNLVKIITGHLIVLNMGNYRHSIQAERRKKKCIISIMYPTWNPPPLCPLTISSIVISSSSTSFFGGAFLPSHGARSTDSYKLDGVAWVCVSFLDVGCKGRNDLETRNLSQYLLTNKTWHDNLVVQRFLTN